MGICSDAATKKKKRKYNCNVCLQLKFALLSFIQIHGCFAEKCTIFTDSKMIQLILKSVFFFCQKQVRFFVSLFFLFHKVRSIFRKSLWNKCPWSGYTKTGDHNAPAEPIQFAFISNAIIVLSIFFWQIDGNFYIILSIPIILLELYFKWKYSFFFSEWKMPMLVTAKPHFWYKWKLISISIQAIRCNEHQFNELKLKLKP